MAVVFLSAPPPALAKADRSRPLTESDAIDIWIARWMRVRRKDILARYGCDPRRLYEIWEGTRFPGSRAKALATLEARFPGLSDRIDSSLHRRLPLKAKSPDQMLLFE